MTNLCVKERLDEIYYVFAQIRPSNNSLRPRSAVQVSRRAEVIHRVQILDDCWKTEKALITLNNYSTLKRNCNNDCFIERFWGRDLHRLLYKGNRM